MATPPTCGPSAFWRGNSFFSTTEMAPALSERKAAISIPAGERHAQGKPAASMNLHPAPWKSFPLPGGENKSDVLPVLNCSSMHFWAEVFSSPHSLLSCTTDLDIRKCKEQLLVVYKITPFPCLYPLTFPMLLGNPAPLKDSDLFIRHISLCPCPETVYGSQNFWLSEERVSACCVTHIPTSYRALGRNPAR